MNIRDGWASEYSRKSFSVQVDENDYAKWLEEAGVDPAKAASIPLKVKQRIMRCLAATWVLVDMADHYDRVGEDAVAEQAKTQLKESEAELANWRGAVKERFGAPA